MILLLETEAPYINENTNNLYYSHLPCSENPEVS